MNQRGAIILDKDGFPVSARSEQSKSDKIQDSDIGYDLYRLAFFDKVGATVYLKDIEEAFNSKIKMDPKYRQRMQKTILELMNRDDVYIIRQPGWGYHAFLEKNIENLVAYLYCIDDFNHFVEKYDTKFIYSHIGDYIIGHLIYGYPIQDTYAYFLKFILVEMTHQNIMEMSESEKKKMKKSIQPILPLIQHQYFESVKEFQTIWNEFLKSKCVQKAKKEMKKMSFKTFMDNRIKYGKFDKEM